MTICNNAVKWSRFGNVKAAIVASADSEMERAVELLRELDVATVADIIIIYILTEDRVDATSDNAHVL